MTSIPIEQTQRDHSVGVVGVGAVGRGIATSIIRHHRYPALYDIRANATEGLAGEYLVCGSPAEVARLSKVVFIAVFDEHQVREAIVGTAGVLGGAEPGDVIVIISTVAVDFLEEMARLAHEKTVSLIDAGITPGSGAAKGESLSLVGGPRDAVECAREFIEDYSSKLYYFGDLGMGMKAKIARNLVIYCGYAAMCEGALLAQTMGVDLEAFLEIIEYSDPMLGGTGAILRARALSLIDDRGTDDQRALRRQIHGLGMKDLAIGVDLAQTYSLTLPMTHEVLNHFDMICGVDFDA